MYKKEAGRTGVGQNSFNTPTELQFKIANVIGVISTKVFLEQIFATLVTPIIKVFNSYQPSSRS